MRPPTVNGQVPNLPRLADFAQWVVHCEPALNWTGPGDFMTAYRENRAEAVPASVESDPFASAVVAFVQDQPRQEWDGSAATLLGNLPSPAFGQRWPSDGAVLGRWLRRSEASLAAVGIAVWDSREGKARFRTLHLKATKGQGDLTLEPKQVVRVPSGAESAEAERAALVADTERRAA